MNKDLTYSWLHTDFRYTLIYESNANNQSFLSINRTRIKKYLFFDWKRGDVISKMSRRFFIFCTKNKMFCTDFRANKLRNFFFSRNKIDGASWHSICDTKRASLRIVTMHANNTRLLPKFSWNFHIYRKRSNIFIAYGIAHKHNMLFEKSNMP